MHLTNEEIDKSVNLTAKKDNWFRRNGYGGNHGESEPMIRNG